MAVIGQKSFSTKIFQHYRYIYYMKNMILWEEKIIRSFLTSCNTRLGSIFMKFSALNLYKRKFNIVYYCYNFHITVFILFLKIWIKHKVWFLFIKYILWSKKKQHLCLNHKSLQIKVHKIIWKCGGKSLINSALYCEKKSRILNKICVHVIYEDQWF